MSSTILVGIDGSEASVRAAKHAEQTARAVSATLLVVYVIEWSPFTFNTPEENEQRHKRREQEIDLAHSKVLEPLISELEKTGIDTEGIVRHGRPAEILNHLAREAKASQIFIGRTGGSDIKSMLFGSVAGKLVQTAEIPVTVIP